MSEKQISSARPKVKWLVILLLAAGVLVLGLFWRPPTLSEADAEKLATIRLDEYAQEANIRAEKFNRTRVEYFEQEKVWQILYRSNTDPVHELSILVDNFRNVELHKDIRSVSTKT